ncbi:hypothetical protein [Candidatus Binatus sp.]|uniref:hypothetical protein n=1 Tax=Candidatus Binatus sp. TaxID=2811406 RepID=UPI003BB035AC
MRLIKLIAPTALIAAVALFAPHAGAQTMGEYATTTAGVGTGAGSMGTSIGNAVSSDDLGGGSSTWGASSLGASFDERAGAAAAGAGQDFEARAGSSAEGSSAEARWPSTSPLDGDSSGRFTDNDRFQDQDRFAERNVDASGDRFPPGVLDQNRGGLDIHYSSSSGLDNGYSSSSGLDNSSVSN